MVITRSVMDRLTFFFFFTASLSEIECRSPVIEWNDGCVGGAMLSAAGREPRDVREVREPWEDPPRFRDEARDDDDDVVEASDEAATGDELEADDGMTDDDDRRDEYTVVMPDEREARDDRSEETV